LYNHDKKERKEGHEFDDLKRKKANHKEKKKVSYISPLTCTHILSFKAKRKKILVSLSLSL
jgi:hypothetical protein